jgi:SNF2 family DNA or RNA helicase
MTVDKNTWTGEVVDPLGRDAGFERDTGFYDVAQEAERCRAADPAWWDGNVYDESMSDLGSAPPPTDPHLKTRLLRHQAPIYLSRRAERFYALFWEMGLGKTKLLLDVACHLALTGQINAILIIAPKSVYPNWIDIEAPIHMRAPHIPFAYHTEGSRKDDSIVMRDMVANPKEFGGMLRIVAMSYDSLGTARGFDFARRMCEKFGTLMALDESSAIGRGSTRRAENCKALGQRASHRWIMSGTPAASSPFALHSQIQFLDPGFWSQRGMKSFEAFKNQFGIFRMERSGTRCFPKLERYQNLAKLADMIRPMCSRLLKDDSGIKLPPKIYTVRQFDMAASQAKLYASVRRRFTADIDHEIATGARVDATLAIVRMARLKQIACGFVTAAMLRPMPDPGTTVDDEYERESQMRGAEHDEDDERLVDAPRAPCLMHANDTNELWRLCSTCMSGGVLPANVSETPVFPCADHAPTITEPTVSPGWVTCSDCRAGGIDRRVRRAAQQVNAPLMREERIVIDIVSPGENPRIQLLVELIDEAAAGLPSTPEEAARARATMEADADALALSDAAREGDRASAMVWGDFLEGQGDISGAGRARGKVIVWCRFRRDIDNVCRALAGRCVRYDGTVRRKDRESVLRRFRDPQDHAAHVLVANTACLSQGVTLTIATTMIYYSCGESLEQRLQSEDRFHRIGQQYPVHIIDITARGTVDHRVIQILRKKYDVAALCTGDRLREWLNDDLDV